MVVEEHGEMWWTRVQFPTSPLIDAPLGKTICRPGRGVAIYRQERYLRVPF